MGKWKYKRLISKKENQGVEAYGKIFQGVLLLSHKRESRDMMLNDTISETETLYVESDKKIERKKISSKLRFLFPVSYGS